MTTMAIRMCYDSYMYHVLFTYFTVLIVQDSLEDQPLAEGTLLLNKKKVVRNMVLRTGVPQWTGRVVSM